MTQTATITPQFIDPPKQPGWSGSVKDSANTRWGVPEKLLPMFRRGESVTVEYEAVTKNGKTFYNVKQIVGHAAPQPAPAPQPLPPAPVPGSQYQPPHPAPVQHTNGHTQPTNGHDKDRTIFITGVVGRAMGSGQYPPTEIKLIALAADEAWNELERRWNR